MQQEGIQMGEMFLKIQGVEGESMDQASPKSHQNEIEIRNWNWITTCNVRWDVNQGGQSTNVKFDTIKIDKIVDKATVVLYQCCVTGKHIPKAWITCRKNDGDQKVEYLTVELDDIIVNKVAFDGSGEEQNLKEMIELSFAQFHMDYKLQQDSGAGSGQVGFGMNIQTMKKV
jgi:type VI secretion system secreted protein Hcp